MYVTDLMPSCVTTMNNMLQCITKLKNLSNKKNFNTHLQKKQNEDI